MKSKQITIIYTISNEFRHLLSFSTYKLLDLLNEF
jgi:hypothetical protein